MLGEIGRQGLTPIHGNRDFLEDESPRISAHPCQMLGFIAHKRSAGDLSYAHNMVRHVDECWQCDVKMDNCPGSPALSSGKI
jgi:hypothetical protein